MAIKEAGNYVQQTGITTTSDAIKLRAEKAATFQMVLTSGSPSTGAHIEVTNDTEANIDAATATWFTPTGHGDRTTGTVLKTEGNASMLTGARLVATDGTWTLSVRQGD